MERPIGRGLGASSMRSFRALFLWNQEIPPSWHIRAFTNQEAHWGLDVLSFIGVTDHIIDHVIELNLQPLSAT